MKKSLLKMVMLMSALLCSVGMWADSFTITFKDNGTDSSTALTTSNFTDQVSDNVSKINSVTATSYCYAGTGGLKVSSNKNNGSFTLTLDQQYAITSVVLSVKNKNATTKSVKVGSTNFTTSDAYNTEEFTDMTFTGTKTTSNTITVALDGTSNSARVAYLASITINYEISGGGGGLVNSIPSFTTHPTGATYTQNDAAVALTIVASGTPTPTYKWYSSTTNSNTSGSEIVGATSASYTPSTTTIGTTYYYCVATNSEGSTASNTAAIVVNAPDQNGEFGYFVKVTGQSDIEDGGHYIIVREEDNTQYAAGTQSSSNQKYLTQNEFGTKGYYNGAVNSSGKPYVYTLKASAESDGYFYLMNDGKYLNGASGSSDLVMGGKSSANFSDWKIEVNSLKNVSITNKAAKSGAGSSAQNRQIRYNTNKFAAYASSTGTVVTLYKRVPSVTIGTYGYATFSSPYALNLDGMTAGYTAYQATGIGDGTVTLESVEGTVAANTGLVIKGAAGTCTIPVVASGTDITSTNKLVAVTEDNTSVPAGAYVLGVDEGVVKFLLTSNEHIATLNAGKSYLAAAGGPANLRFVFVDSETGIAESMTSAALNGAIFNLAGQRVGNEYKGIVIKNGKKYLNK